MKNNRLKNAKAITLIALVVTIIVLLILAGVSISVLTGENGLLNRAGQAKEQSKIAQFEEQIKLAYNDAIIASAVSGNGAKVNIGDWMFSMIDSGANIIPEETDTPNEYLITIDGEDDLYVFNANSKKLSKYEKEFSDDWYKDYTYTTDDTANTITLIDYIGTDKVTYVGKSAKIGGKEYNTVLQARQDSEQSHTSIFNNKDVTKVKLQNGITEIGERCVFWCDEFKIFGYTEWSGAYRKWSSCWFVVRIEGGLYPKRCWSRR